MTAMEQEKPANVLRLEELIRQGLVHPRNNKGPRYIPQGLGLPKGIVGAIIADR
jgi:hypothetical protein